jgi:hypothetical protein
LARDGAGPLSLPLDEAEAMTERIAAECYRPVFRVFEELLSLGTRVDGCLQSRFEIIDVYIHVHRRPMTLVVARLLRVIGSLRSRGLLKQTDFGIASAEYDHARDGLCRLRESKGACVKLNGFREVWYVNANRY